MFEWDGGSGRKGDACGLFYFRITVCQKGGQPVSLPVIGGDGERAGRAQVGDEEEVGAATG